MEPGQVIDGTWVVDEPLGVGGMGSVFLCHNQNAPGIVAAIKVLSHELVRIREARVRFAREAEILYQLDHPNIVAVHNVRLDAEPPYIEMAFVAGRSLEGVGKLDVRHALELARQLAEALAYLHDRGLAHRDVKPANLIQGDRGLVLVDFGLVTPTDGGAPITEHGALLGTAAYSPPEWVDGDRLDPMAWDRYGLGVVLHELLTGRPAFPVPKGTDRRAAIVRTMMEKASLPCLSPPDVAPEVRELVEQLTAREAEARPQSTRWIVETIDTLLASEVAPVRRITPAPVTRRQALGVGLGLSAAIAGLVAVAVVGVVGAALWWRSSTHATTELRPLEVTVSGLSSTDELALEIDGLPAPERSGYTFRFDGAAPGPHRLRWTLGPDCPGPGACAEAEACPVWCASGTEVVVVEPGSGAQRASVTVSEPRQRPVRIVVDAPSARVRVDGREIPQADGRHELGQRSPGQLRAVVEVGACGAEDEGCAADGRCPPGCWSSVEAVVVAVGAGPLTHRVRPPEVAPPEPEAPAPAAPRPSPPRPAPSAATGAGALVTARQFGAWLEGHPRWARDAAIARGDADDDYLFTFDPASGASVTEVSWSAAAAFCAGSGGLAPLEAEPTTWPDGGGAPFQEWRVDGGQPAWRRFDGATSSQGSRAHANAFTGFRCAR